MPSHRPIGIWRSSALACRGAALLSCALATVAAGASSPYPEAEAWFIGTWAVACDSTVGRDNPLVIVFRGPDGTGLLMTLVTRQAAGLTTSLTRVIVKGPIVDGQVPVDFDHADRGLNHAILRLTPGGYYVKQNTPPNGKISVRDGISLRTGQPGARYRRCSAD